MLKMTGALLIFGAGVWAWRQQAAARFRSWITTMAEMPVSWQMSFTI